MDAWLPPDHAGALALPVVFMEFLKMKKIKAFQPGLCRQTNIWKPSRGRRVGGSWKQYVVRFLNICKCFYLYFVYKLLGNLDNFLIIIKNSWTYF
jgi:hypothetical protein